MYLCIDIGNSTIHFGLYHSNNDEIVVDFKIPSRVYSSDEIGIFLISTLKLHKIDILSLTSVGISSVVPVLNPTLISMSEKYIRIIPTFLDNRYHHINLSTYNANGLGADRLSASIASTYLYPNTNLVVIDCGTANTISIIDKDGVYISGAILPGIYTSILALKEKTALLPTIELKKPQDVLLNTTQNHLLSGSYYLFLGGIKQIIKEMTSELKLDDFYTICCGGNGLIFKEECLYDVYINDLVLFGIKIFLSSYNQDIASSRHNV